MIRAAAKNHEDVAVVVDPADYQDLLASLGGGEGRADFYRRLAWKAFQHTAGYDALVSEWFWGQIGASPCIPLISVHAQKSKPWTCSLMSYNSTIGVCLGVTAA
jgi:AICAR transformylase/IMP cyclohydrolase PurH